MKNRAFGLVCALGIVLLPLGALSEESSLIAPFGASGEDFSPSECHIIANDLDRLSCYDRSTRYEPAPPGNESGQSQSEKRVVTTGFKKALNTKDAALLVSELRQSDFAELLSDEDTSLAEEIILDYVKPLPATDAEANKNGYEALSKLVPDNRTYVRKARRYADIYENEPSEILKRMDKSTDEFNDVTLYQHPNTPRFADVRSYLSVYAGQKDGEAWLRMRLNYTNDNWLFVANASLNIDGEMVRLPYDDWLRDNDSEIWEWIDVVVDPDLRETLERVAASKKTMVRFEGRQSHDDVTLGEADKKAIRDMLLVGDFLRCCQSNSN